MRYVSLFSGIEAATVAWAPLGWEPVAFSEIDPFCCELLRQRYPGVPNLGDITKIDWSRFNERYGAVDLIVGGSPCQSFSVAGGRSSLEGQSGLMFEFVRAVRELNPRWFVWENVPGALTAKGLDGQAGGAFGQLLCEMGKLGYGLAWRILDSQFFGVAQRRERLFLIGHLGDMRAEQVLFEPESLRGDFKTGREKRKELAAALGIGDSGLHARTHGEPIGFKYHQSDKARSFGAEEGLSPTLTADYHNPAIAFSKTYRPHFAGDAETWEETGLANTLNCNDAPSGSRFNELVCEPYCMQADHLPQNGTNAHEGICKTIDTQTPNAVVCMTDTQPNTKIDDGGGTCGTLTARMYRDPPVICIADDNGKSAVDENLCGTLKVCGAAPMCALYERQER